MLQYCYCERRNIFVDRAMGLPPCIIPAWGFPGVARAPGEQKPMEKHGLYDSPPSTLPRLPTSRPQQRVSRDYEGPHVGATGRRLDFLAFGVIGGFLQWRVEVGEGKEGSRAQCLFLKYCSAFIKIYKSIQKAYGNK